MRPGPRSKSARWMTTAKQEEEREEPGSAGAQKHVLLSS
jgi:hypothetical protein